MSISRQSTREDPLSWIARIASKFRSLWIRRTYPFFSLGRDFCVHYSIDLKRSIAPYIKIGDSVLIDRDVWVNIPVAPDSSEPVIQFDEGCTVGRRCVISARNRIHFERDVIFAPSVLVMDHNHAFEDVNVPIKSQGITHRRDDTHRGGLLDWFRSGHCLRQGRTRYRKEFRNRCERRGEPQRSSKFHCDRQPGAGGQAV